MKTIRSLLYPTFLTLITFFTSNAQVTNGLVAKYSFNNGNADDEVGNVNGTFNNVTLTEDRFGNENAAVQIQGTPSYINFGDHFDFFSQADGRFSFSFWILSPNTGNQLIINKYGNDLCRPGEEQREFFIRINPENRIELVFFADLEALNFRGIQGDVLINDECWHHIVVNYDGSNDGNDGLSRVEIFTDGVRNINSFTEASRGVLGDIQNSTSHLAFGMSVDSEGNGCAHQFQGSLDDVQIFDRKLTIEEVNLLFNETNPFSGLPRDELFRSDITICDLESATLNAFRPNATYLWSDGSNNPTLEIFTPGTYAVTVTSTCEVIEDELFVDFGNSPSVSLGQDSAFCMGNRIILDATQPDNSTYLWQDGSNDPTFLVTNTGTFTVNVTNGCGTVQDSIFLEQLTAPQINLKADTFFCDGSSITLDATQSISSNYLWQDGTANSTLEVNEAGTYTISINNACGSTIDSVNVSIASLISAIDLGPDQDFCTQDSIILDASSSNVTTYLWQDGSQTPSILVTSPGLYVVTLSNECGSITDQINITSSDCCSIFVPNVFSPNGDGINDNFEIFTQCNTISAFRMQVFSRWGGLIFESQNLNATWNGTFKGELLKGDTFVWVIEYNDGINDQVETGTVVIIR